MKKRKYMVAAAWVAVLVGIGVSSVVLIHKKDSAEIGAQTASSAKDGSGIEESQEPIEPPFPAQHTE